VILDLSKPLDAPDEFAARLAERSRAVAATGCREWLGTHTDKGYGKLTVRGRDVRAHRLAFALVHGPLASDEGVTHTCGNRGCIEVSHLRGGMSVYGGGQKDSISERRTRDAAIISDYREMQSTIAVAKKYGLSRITVGRIIRSKSTVPMLPRGHRPKVNAPSIAEYIAATSKRNEKTGCLEWTGRIMHKGYGIARFGRRQVRAHRLSYELNVGPISNDLFVCHHCDNRRCIEPTHLFLGTHQDNIADMLTKRRQRREAN
jgi:hypothetical protein